MSEQLEQRLKILKAEYQTGQQELAELETQAASLRETLLRISGAIQVLEREQLEQRLKMLKAEYQTGQQELAELETQAASLRETLLRISGAIQVLEEELAKTDTPD